MTDRVTVLIGAAELLPTLRTRVPGGGEVLTFRDLDSVTALETIVARQPTVVALERVFAATTRGQALVDRIRQDPVLASVEVQVVAHDTAEAQVLAGVGVRPGRGSASAPAGALDYHGTRRAPRVPMRPGLEALVDGNPVALVDLSSKGAQVLSPGVLRPNQRVRLVLPESGGGLRMSATIAWAAYEIPSKVTPRYRAGLQFESTMPEALAAFCARHGRH